MSAVSPLIEEAVRSPESGRAPPVIGIRPFSLLRDFHHDTIVCRPRSPPRDVPHSRRREPSPRETSRRVLDPAGRKWNSMWQHCSVTALISLSPGPSLSLSLFLFIYLSHLLCIIPCSYRASTCYTALPSYVTLYVVSVRQARDLPMRLVPHIPISCKQNLHEIGFSFLFSYYVLCRIFPRSSHFLCDCFINTYPSNISRSSFVVILMFV